MKNILFTILLAGILAGCNQSAKIDKDNVALIEKYVKAVESEDYNTMEDLLSDDYQGFGPSISDSVSKAVALANWKENIENLYDKIEYQRSRNVAVTIPSGENKGHWVSNWAQLNITYMEDRGAVTIWANTIYKIENGKIVKSYTFYNEADALRQLGYVFINPNDL